MQGDKYREAGVDISKGNRFAKGIQHLTRDQVREEVLSGVGGFGAVFEPGRNYQNPVMLAATDGVGTKLKIARMAEKFDTVGIDLVAMCANDILAQGGEPLVFLDYLAMGQLEEDVAKSIVDGIIEGCRLAGCSLVGGETAEMPGFYQAGMFDLAGFCVGVAEKEKIVQENKILPGDLLVGIQSNGIHSNGYSLARKILLQADGGQYQLKDSPSPLEVDLEKELLRPTRIYVSPVLSMMKKYNIKGMAHITGGGIPGNVSRILPPKMVVRINRSDLDAMNLPIYKLLKHEGKLTDQDMTATFNLGVGFVLVLDKEEAPKVCEDLQKQGENGRIIGEIELIESDVHEQVDDTRKVIIDD